MVSQITAITATAEIAESVFEAMLGLPLNESAAKWYSAPERVTASVNLSGDWHGAVLLECTRRQACGFAARFLSMEPVEVVDDVVRDVLGELANMVSGNLKSILGRGIQLSMPSVVDGDYHLRICGAEKIERLAFDSAEGTFWVTLITE